MELVIMTVTEKDSIIQNYNRQYQFLFQISSKGINQSPPETGLENTSCKVVLNSFFPVKEVVSTTLW